MHKRPGRLFWRRCERAAPLATGPAASAAWPALVSSRRQYTSTQHDRIIIITITITTPNHDGLGEARKTRVAIYPFAVKSKWGKSLPRTAAVVNKTSRLSPLSSPSLSLACLHFLNSRSLCLSLTAAIGICPLSYCVSLSIDLSYPCLAVGHSCSQSRSRSLASTDPSSSHSLHSRDLRFLLPPILPPTRLLLPHSIVFQHGLQHGRHSERCAPSPRGLEAGCSRATQRHPERH
jgi:hypothetical protein